jgi:hypothetical protein
VDRCLACEAEGVANPSCLPRLGFVGLKRKPDVERGQRKGGKASRPLIIFGLSSEARSTGGDPVGLASEAALHGWRRLFGLKPRLKPSILVLYCIRHPGKGKRSGTRLLA